VATLGVGTGELLALIGEFAVVLILGLILLRREQRSVRVRLGLFFEREVPEQKEELDAGEAGQELEAVRGVAEAGDVEGVGSTHNERERGEEEAEEVRPNE
jgi:hypothetical protein